MSPSKLTYEPPKRHCKTGLKRTKKWFVVSVVAFLILATLELGISQFIPLVFIVRVVSILGVLAFGTLYLIKWANYRSEYVKKKSDIKEANRNFINAIMRVSRKIFLFCLVIQIVSWGFIWPKFQNNDLPIPNHIMDGLLWSCIVGSVTIGFVAFFILFACSITERYIDYK